MGFERYDLIAAHYPTMWPLLVPGYVPIINAMLDVIHDVFANADDIERGEEILRALCERYLGGTDSGLARFLLGRVDRETAIALEPRTLVSWDYRERMGDAGR